MAKTIAFKGGEAALDRVLDRIENQYWKIEICNFRSFAAGFTKFQGEWRTSDNGDGTIDVLYSYTLFSNGLVAYPFHWLFTKLVWRNYMKHALSNIKNLAHGEEPYLLT